MNFFYIFTSYENKFSFNSTLVYFFLLDPGIDFSYQTKFWCWKQKSLTSKNCWKSPGIILMFLTSLWVWLKLCTLDFLPTTFWIFSMAAGFPDTWPTALSSHTLYLNESVSSKTSMIHNWLKQHNLKCKITTVAVWMLKYLTQVIAKRMKTDWWVGKHCLFILSQ